MIGALAMACSPAANGDLKLKQTYWSLVGLGTGYFAVVDPAACAAKTCVGVQGRYCGPMPVVGPTTPPPPPAPVVPPTAPAEPPAPEPPLEAQTAVPAGAPAANQESSAASSAAARGGWP